MRIGGKNAVAKNITERGRFPRFSTSWSILSRHDEASFGILVESVIEHVIFSVARNFRQMTFLQ